VSNSTPDEHQLGVSALTRRDRLERIANAERDRRAGLAELAIATIGEPTEWPARAVIALARLSNPEDETRRVLEEGLDLWARETGLGDLEPHPTKSDEPPQAESSDANDPLGLIAHLTSIPPELEAPLDPDELDRAFAEAEAEVDSMHSVNDVAERVLLDEPNVMDSFSHDDLTPVATIDADDPFDVAPLPDTLGIDAAFVEPATASRERGESTQPPDSNRAPLRTEVAADSRRHIVLATLENWLQNLERRKARRPA